MTTRAAAALSAVVTVAAVALPTAQTPVSLTAAAGVLVGVHRVPDIGFARLPMPAATLRTLWLETTGAAVGTVPGLLVPRRSGFWWADLVRFCTEEPDEGANGTPLGDAVDFGDDLRAGPIAEREQSQAGVTGSCRSTNVHCSVDRRIGINWVWPEFVSLTRGGEYGCGAHPDAAHDHAIYRLADLVAPLTANQVFGTGAEARLQRSFERARAEHVTTFGADCVGDAPFSPVSLHVWREDGAWRFEGWRPTDRGCGVGFHYTASVELTGVVGRSPQPPRRWRRLPGARDALASPDGRWVVLIKDTEVTLAPARALDRPVAAAPLVRFDDSVVMVEWATGTNVAGWRNEVGPPAAR